MWSTDKLGNGQLALGLAPLLPSGAATSMTMTPNGGGAADVARPQLLLIFP